MAVANRSFHEFPAPVGGVRCLGKKSRSKTYQQTSEHTSIVNHAACTVISFYFVAPPPAAFTGCLCRVHITIFCSRRPGAARLVTIGSPFLTYRQHAKVYADFTARTQLRDVGVVCALCVLISGIRTQEVARLTSLDDVCDGTDWWKRNRKRSQYTTPNATAPTCATMLAGTAVMMLMDFLVAIPCNG